MKNNSVRIRWVDYVKVVACILVVLGHFFQSMTKSNILPANDLYQWFITTIYYFHVPLFFICSGFLYQKYSNVTNLCRGGWRKNIIKKALNLGIPYFVFSTLTWILKTVFSGSVNQQSEGLISTWFLHPSSPYWYLYCLFFIFITTPTFKDKKDAKIALFFALIAKLITMVYAVNVYFIGIVLLNEIWFVIGMCICIFDLKLSEKNFVGIVLGVIFIILSIIVYNYSIDYSIIPFILGMIACIAVILLIASNERKISKSKLINMFAKYTMPIFLMHTLFAAPIRVILMKIGITNSLMHVVIGLAVSFIGPIIAAIIMEKVKWLEILIYPGKVIKIN